MNNAAAVGIFDGLANGDKSSQEFAKFEQSLATITDRSCWGVQPLNGASQALALNQSHREKRTAARIDSQTVHGHDARMFQLGCRLGFAQETLAQRRR